LQAAVMVHEQPISGLPLPGEYVHVQLASTQSARNLLSPSSFLHSEQRIGSFPPAACELPQEIK
jgi:hypothetical protein